MRMASGLTPGLPVRRRPPVYGSTDFGAVMTTAVPDGATPGPGLEEPAGEATVLRMLLGAQLRRLREATGISAEKAGYEIRAWSTSSSSPAPST